MTTSLTQLHPEDTLMFKESREGSEAVARFLANNSQTLERIAARLRANPPKAVITCARGSSDHAATYGKYLIETLIGVPTSSSALSVMSLFAAPVLAQDTLCIAISQSGRSPDLLKAVEAYKANGAYVVVLVNDETSPLATLADDLLPLKAGPELSVAATKSYMTTLAGLAALVSYWQGGARLIDGVKSMPALMHKAFALDWTSAIKPLLAAKSLFVIGRGYSFAIAQEAALKFKETCGLHAEAFSSAEVRHGPMAIVGEGFPILGFATSDVAGDDVRAVASEFSTRGATVRLASAGEAGTLPVVATEPELEPILMASAFYRLVNATSVASGRNPDAPPHLNKVTQTH